eukprot:scaffold1.g5777.t1
MALILTSDTCVQIATAVGGDASAEDCEALYHHHQGYLSLDPKFQSEVAFLAMVEDAQKHYVEAATPGSAARSAGAAGTSEGNGTAAGGASAAGGLASSRDFEDKDEEEEEGDGSEMGGTLAATRSRRTPKRSALSTPSGAKAGRTPLSTGKRQRAGARDDDIYEYYDEGEEVTASARKRRASKRLEFQPTAAMQQPTRRKERADEAKGIDALLALAVAGAEGQEGTEGEDEGLAGQQELEAELPPPPPRRRTPHTTPAKRPRPGSAHATPGRGKRLAAASPSTLASPWALGMDGSDLGYLNELPLADLGYLTSPAFGQAGAMRSPQNPIPRLRSRKQPPARSPSTLSPLLFGRRASIAGGPAASLLASVASLGYTGVEDSASQALSPLEAQLRHCLAVPARRWCRFEFFYSALDRPFFMQTAIDDLLRHCGLAGVTALTRKEWGLLRAGLGRPRRLSPAFLREERCRLEQWRQRCREHYSRGGGGAGAAGGGGGAAVVAAEGEEAELPRAISFDRQELGVELVADVDVMPMDAGDFLPPSMLVARPRLALNGRLWVGGKQVAPPPRPPLPLPASLPLQASLPLPAPPGGAGLLAGLAPAALLKPEPAQAEAATKLAAADPLVLSELSVLLDKKEALLVQLRAMNDEAAAGVHTDVPGADSGPFNFKGAYAQVVLQLRDMNEEVQRKLVQLEKEPGENGAEEGPPGSSGLEAALGQTPLSADSLANVALGEAATLMAACRQKLADAAAEAAQPPPPPQQPAANGVEPGQTPEAPPVPAADGAASSAAQPAPAAGMDWAAPEAQRLASLIQGCVWSMVLLQRGCDRSMPLQVLTDALDTSLAHARPKADANLPLFAEVQQAMAALKQQLLAAPS